jgi:hypothetical protein
MAWGFSQYNTVEYYEWHEVYQTGNWYNDEETMLCTVQENKDATGLRKGK